MSAIKCGVFHFTNTKSPLMVRFILEQDAITPNCVFKRL